jgi:hypothetical protein
MIRIPKTIRPIVLLAAAALLGSSLACSSFSSLAPTPTATPSNTPTPKPTRTPTGTDIPADTPGSEPSSYLDWPVVLSDSFDDNANKWDLGKADDEYISGDMTLAGGKLTLDVTAKQPVFWWLTPKIESLADVFVVVDVKKISGAESADFGLVFREYDDDHYYYFSIYPPTQEYQLSMFVDGEWTTLIDWTETGHIDPYGANRISVLAQGSRITLFIDDTEIGGLDDATVEEGVVGVGFSLYEDDETLKVVYDNFEVRAP